MGQTGPEAEHSRPSIPTLSCRSSNSTPLIFNSAPNHSSIHPVGSVSHMHNSTDHQTSQGKSIPCQSRLYHFPPCFFGARLTLSILNFPSQPCAPFVPQIHSPRSDTFSLIGIHCRVVEAYQTNEPTNQPTTYQKGISSLLALGMTPAEGF